MRCASQRFAALPHTGTAFVGLAGSERFHDFYPGVSESVKGILPDDCKPQYELYLHNESSLTKQGCSGCAVATVTRCVLDALAAVDKANMASATVILGLLPGTLSLAGSTTTDVGMLMLRRPVLGFLLSAGSLAINPLRAFEYLDPVRRIGQQQNSFGLYCQSAWQRRVIAFAQYLLAAAAVLPT